MAEQLLHKKNCVQYMTVFLLMLLNALIYVENGSHQCSDVEVLTAEPAMMCTGALGFTYGYSVLPLYTYKEDMQLKYMTADYKKQKIL